MGSSILLPIVCYLFCSVCGASLLIAWLIGHMRLNFIENWTLFIILLGMRGNLLEGVIRGLGMDGHFFTFS